MPRIFLLPLAMLVLVCPSAEAGDKKTTILLIGKERDHALGTHEYIAVCDLLAKCLKQTPGVETVVSNGWPKDADMPKDVKAIVLYTANGGDVLFNPLIKERTQKLLKSGVGLTAIHWGTGAGEKTGEDWQKASGAWFSTSKNIGSRLDVRSTRLKQPAPDHPISRGWKEHDLRDEYYLDLKFQNDVKPVMTIQIDKKEHTVGWAYERPESNGGRSFGCVCGHFHDNFFDKDFRRALVNGILWTARLEVPADGAPVAITSVDHRIPPRRGKSETIKLFNGKDLAGWEGYDDLWSVKDDVIIAKNKEPLKYSTYLLTKRKFTDFRLVFSAKLVESEMHSGIAFWGAVDPKADGKVKDVKTDRTQYTYKGHLVMFPSGWGMYDLFGRNGLPVDGGPAKKVGKQHDWNDMEILAVGNRVRFAVNGTAVVDWSDPEPHRIRNEGSPIGLQLHSNTVPQEIHFKGLTLTTFPPEDRLLTVK